MTITAESTYESDLNEVTALLAQRFSRCLAEVDERIAEQLPDALSDAINNTWREGIEIAVWAEAAAKRLGI